MKRIYYILILSVILFSCEKTISTFQSQNFIKYFGSGYESKGYDVIQLADGNYVFTGYDKSSTNNYRIFAVKVDKNGNILWTRLWGDNWVNSNRREGRIVKEMSDGLLLAGIIDSSGITHSFIMKININGDKDSIWYKEYGGAKTNVIVSDILFAENNIFLIGQANSVNQSISDYYISRLDMSGNIVSDNRILVSTRDGSNYRKGFIQSDNILLVGTLGPLNNVTISQLDPNTKSGPSYEVTSEKQQARDAIFINDQLFVLVNLNASDSLKVLKFNLNFEKVSYALPIVGIEGKSFALLEGGSLLISGDQVEGIESKIKFIRLGSDGVAGSPDEFRTFTGYAGKIIETSDKGIILVGTTSPASNGTMIQLIKTDRDLFLLKP